MGLTKIKSNNQIINLVVLLGPPLTSVEKKKELVHK